MTFMVVPLMENLCYSGSLLMLGMTRQPMPTIQLSLVCLEGVQCAMVGLVKPSW